MLLESVQGLRGTNGVRENSRPLERQYHHHHHICFPRTT